MEALQKSGSPLYGPRGGYIPPHLQHYRPVSIIVIVE